MHASASASVPETHHISPANQVFARAAHAAAEEDEDNRRAIMYRTAKTRPSVWSCVTPGLFLEYLPLLIAIVLLPGIAIGVACLTFGIRGLLFGFVGGVCATIYAFVTVLYLTTVASNNLHDRYPDLNSDERRRHRDLGGSVHVDHGTHPVITSLKDLGDQVARSLVPREMHPALL